ncbi:T9SS type A sorting domain-containing protein [Cryomorpha ignava]|uniref:T9SS type A sorting domain-containing protein n=1 Tax=Cryomorpha ignava TaxID=101383 RepID=A0A7K3WMI7_9FLAO|nr:T9SS type A sorting domain-containing protein [Cryomorpha ignava]NEN22221.1 T9SS type A sorting domain-containing protein [Cryomorpha ignava]
MNKIVLINSGIAFLIGITCTAQTDVNYLYHKQYSNINQWVGGGVLNLEQDLKTGLFFSEISNGVQNPATFDFSLSSEPDLYEISPAFENFDSRFTLFRTHSESLETLKEMLVFSKSGFNYNPGADFSTEYFLFTFLLQSGSHLINSWGLDIENTSEDLQKDLVILYDDNNNEIFKRELNFQNAAGFASSRGDGFLRMENKLSNEIHIRDFRFEENVQMVVSGDTTLIYYPSKTLYQEVSNHDTILYSGIMEYTGVFKSRDLHVDGNVAFRVFELSGVVDLDVTDQENFYTSDSGSTDLILVKYTVDGHVDYVKKLSDFQSENPTDGNYYPVIFVDDDKVSIRFRLSVSSDSTVDMAVYAENIMVDSGIIDGTSFSQTARSPLYFTCIEKASGDFLGITKSNFITENEVFASTNGSPTKRLTSTGQILLKVHSTYPFTDYELIVESIYPDTFIYDLEDESAGQYSRFVEIPVIPDQNATPISTVLPYEGFPNNNVIFNNLLRIDNDVILLSGALYSSVNLTVGDTIISLQTTPDPSFGVDGILLAVSEILVSTNEIEKPKYSIFPNPTSERLRIDLPYNGFLNYEILSVTGKQILKGTISESLPINVRGLQPAVYLLVISDATNTQTVKFVKE